MRKTSAKILAGSAVNYRLKKKIELPVVSFSYINRVKDFFLQV